MKVSIIVPVLNEAKNIQRLITRLIEEENHLIAELLVVDGGSTDDTVQRARNAGATVLISPTRGRAIQMNYAVQFATGDLLYFVHGDTVPPKGYVNDLLQAVQEGFPVGCFRFRFESRNPLLRINGFMTRFRYLWCRGGDQTLYVTREAFKELGGYRNDYLVMEEYEFIVRAQARYPFKIIPKEVLVSSRKYDINGYARVQIANFIAFNMFRFKFPQQQIANTYQRLLKKSN